jgi:predicted MFS family arabinose efflux permease
MASLRARVATIGGGASLVPLVILFGLNAVDELDRSAFGLLLPEIKKYFGLNLTGVTSLQAAVIPAGLLFALPIARYADRGRRRPIAIGGASAWGVFSILTGLAPTVVLLGLARVGAGLGRAVNNPVHPSMLSDYYPPNTRAKVFSAHRIANPVGQFAGPLIAGFVAAAVGWRVPFVILAVPTFVFVLIAMRLLREPDRTGERLVEGDVRFRDAFRSLWGVRTLRRLWAAFPFLAAVAIGLAPLLSLYYEEVFHVRVAVRGVIQAFDAPFTVLGLAIGAVLIDRGLFRDAGRALRIIGAAAALIGLFILGVAWAPALWIGVTFNYAINVLAPVLLTGGVVIVSLVSPPESRASAFALFEIFSLFGVIALPIVGRVGDALGIRAGMAILTPALLIGSVIVVSAGRFVKDDIARIYPDYGAGAAQGPVIQPGDTL